MCDRRTEWLAVLGLTPEASQPEIRRAYRDLVQVWHPDRFGHNEALRLRAEETLKAVNEAYEQLAGDRGLFEVRHAPETPSGGGATHANRTATGDRRTSGWTSDLRAIAPYALLAAVAVALLWMVVSTVEPAEARSRGRLTAPAAPADVSNAQSTAADSDPGGMRRAGPADCTDPRARPGSGTEFGGEHRPGHGTLTITNETPRDALAVLSDSAIDVPRRAVYVRRGEQAAVGAIPPGTYRLRFQFGDVWTDDRRFCHPDRTAEFDDLLTWDEQPGAEGVRYSAIAVTLNALPEDVPGPAPHTPLALPRP